MSSDSCMSCQVIPGGSHNSCCHSHSFRERAILEGIETRKTEDSLIHSKPVSTSQRSRGRITLAEVASGCESRRGGERISAQGTGNLLADFYQVPGDCCLLAQNQKRAKMEISASEFNRTLVSFSARCIGKFQV